MHDAAMYNMKDDRSPYSLVQKMLTSKYSGSRVIVAKIADIGPPGAPQYFFSEKNLERSNYCTPRHKCSSQVGKNCPTKKSKHQLQQHLQNTDVI